MSTDQELEQELERLAGQLRPRASVVNEVMQRLEIQAPQTDAPAPVRLVPDVPAGWADGVPRGDCPVLHPPDRRHVWRLSLMLQQKAFRWSLAAVAAAGIVLAINFWPQGPGRGSGGGVAWADVVQRLATARNLTFWMEPHYVSADGKPGHLPWFREYHQDPGLMRREYYGLSSSSAPKPPDQKEPLALRNYQIRRIAGQEQQWYFINPGDKKTWHEITVGAPHDRAFQVQDWWNRLQEISSDATTRIGEELVTGKPVVMFEANADKLWGPPSGQGAVTTLRIWVDAGTSWPVRVRFTGQYPDGTRVEQTMEDLQWNLDLPPDFFTPPADYALEEGSRHYYLPAGTRLKEDVRVRLYAENGFEVFNQSQVEEVGYLRASAQGIVGLVGFAMPQDLQNRWQGLWPQIQGKLLYDFNGELTAEYGTWHTHTFPSSFDLSNLNLTVEQFQAKYLDLPK